LQQPFRGAHVRRTLFVNVNAKPRIFASQRAGGSGVIQVNVRQ